MPAGLERKKTALERFFEWAQNLGTGPLDKVLTEQEKLDQGNRVKNEAWQSLEEDGDLTPTPEPTPSPTPIPLKPRMKINPKTERE